MLSAWPCTGIDIGYDASSRAPRKYSGRSGPGTFEMTTLNGGRMWPAVLGIICSIDGAASSALLLIRALSTHGGAWRGEIRSWLPARDARMTFTTARTTVFDAPYCARTAASSSG